MIYHQSSRNLHHHHLLSEITFADRERVGMGRLGTIIEGETNIARAQRRLARDKTLDDGFSGNLTVYFNILEQHKLTFNASQQEIILSKGTSYHNTQHLNALGVIMGYFITGGKKINRNRFDEAVKVTGKIKLDDGSQVVKSSDLVKYSRFWLVN